MSSPCACYRVRVRSWCSPAAVVGSRAAPKAAATGVLADFCHVERYLGSMLSAQATVWVEWLCAAKHQASARKAASYVRPLLGLGGSFQDEGKTPPCSVQIN